MSWKTTQETNNEVKEKTAVKTSNIDLKESSVDCLKALKGVIIKPVDAVKEFVQDNKLVAGIIMIVVTAIATGIYKLATLKSTYDQTKSAFSYWHSSPEPEYLKEFFTTCGTNLLEYALIVVIGYIIVSKLLKGKATWKQMVAAVGISLSLVLIANLVNSILVFIDKEAIIYIMSYIRTFATIYSFLILYQAVKEVGEIDKILYYIDNNITGGVAARCANVIGATNLSNDSSGAAQNSHSALIDVTVSSTANLGDTPITYNRRTLQKP